MSKNRKYLGVDNIPAEFENVADEHVRQFRPADNDPKDGSQSLIKYSFEK